MMTFYKKDVAACYITEYLRKNDIPLNAYTVIKYMDELGLINEDKVINFIKQMKEGK